jgi:hypothetical protein
MKPRRNYLLTGLFKKSKAPAKINGDGRIVTVSATRKPRLEGGTKGRNYKQPASLPGSPALWALGFTFAYKYKIQRSRQQ